MHLALLGGVCGDFEICFFLRAVSPLKMAKSTWVPKKVPTWEGKVPEQKQKQFWKLCAKLHSLGTCKI